MIGEWHLCSNRINRPYVLRVLLHRTKKRKLPSLCDQASSEGGGGVVCEIPYSYSHAILSLLKIPESTSAFLLIFFIKLQLCVCVCMRTC